MKPEPSDSISAQPASPRLPFLERLARKPVMFDGAMGTMLYQRGFFLNICYDELCLSKPDIIAAIHAEYAEAGAEVLETNTFGASRIKLAPYGLADRAEAINRAGVRLARQAAGARIYVAASAGPCLAEDGFRSVSPEEAEAAFEEQFAVFAEEGADLIALETFYDLDQLRLAARVARRSGLTTLASFALTPAALRSDADPRPETLATRQLNDDPNVDAIGINCGLGPAEMFHPVKRMMALAQKPVVVMPNAGGPREVAGRMLYLNSPEYFTEFCKRFIELGARGIGGCCGATPDHIRMAARAIQGMSGVKEHVRIRTAAAATAEAPPDLPVAKKSPFGAKLAAGRPVASVELLPPASAAGLPAFLDKCRQCQAAGVDAINLPDGPRASARMSVLATAFLIRRELDIEPIPHYCGRDRNLIGMQSDLIGGCALGLRTWLFITGDPPKLGNYPDATGVFDLDAIGLAALATNLGRGLDAAGEPIGAPAPMLIGVGANPGAVDMTRETDRFFRKTDAGAEFAITQPVFDADALMRFLDIVDKRSRPGIPIVVGLYPMVSFKNAQFMSRHVPGVVVPDRVLERMSRCADDKQAGAEEGVAIAREIRDKVASSVAGFQTSAPLGRMDIALAVLAR